MFLISDKRSIFEGCLLQTCVSKIYTPTLCYKMNLVHVIMKIHILTRKQACKGKNLSNKLYVTKKSFFKDVFET